MCFGRIVELLDYWRTSPPVHDLLALRYLGAPEKRPHRAGGGSSRGAPSRRLTRRSEATEHEQVSQIPQIVNVLGVPVRKMSDKTRALYEYAQSILKPKEEASK